MTEDDKTPALADVLAMFREAQSPEGFQRLRADHLNGEPRLALLPAGLALRLAANPGGMAIIEEWFASLTELQEIGDALERIILEGSA